MRADSCVVPTFGRRESNVPRGGVKFSTSVVTEQRPSVLRNQSSFEEPDSRRIEGGRRDIPVQTVRIFNFKDVAEGASTAADVPLRRLLPCRGSQSPEVPESRVVELRHFGRNCRGAGRFERKTSASPIVEHRVERPSGRANKCHMPGSITNPSGQVGPCTGARPQVARPQHQRKHSRLQHV